MAAIPTVMTSHSSFIIISESLALRKPVFHLHILLTFNFQNYCTKEDNGGVRLRGDGS